MIIQNSAYWFAFFVKIIFKVKNCIIFATQIQILINIQSMKLFITIVAFFAFQFAISQQVETVKQEKPKQEKAHKKSKDGKSCCADDAKSKKSCEGKDAKSCKDDKSCKDKKSCEGKDGKSCKDKKSCEGKEHKMKGKVEEKPQVEEIKEAS